MLERRIKVETEIKIPIRAYHSINSRHQRYQLQRRGKIAKLLKPKPLQRL